MDCQTSGDPEIPNHRIIHPAIGDGAFGKVYLALTLTNTYRAIKVVRRDRFPEERPFRQEFAGVLKFEPISRTHEGFVSILYVGEEPKDEYFYYIMEVADDIVHGQSIKPETYKAKTLARLLATQGRLPLRDCFKIGLSLIKALGCLHDHKLVHRDIKPANIIFVNGVPKLADIGLVTSIEAGSFYGTEGYVPREGPGRPPADVYALGKVLYVISTGRHVLDFPGLPSDMEESSFPQFCRFKAFLLEACAENVCDRFQSAQEMHDALAKIAQTAPDRTTVADQSAQIPVQLVKASAQVVIAYKSGAQPDTQLLEFLARELTSQGKCVFIDRYHHFGVRWAKEIEAKIRNADALIVLLSGSSIHSEMVEYEVGVAHDSFREKGKPSLLPIRVMYGQPLAESLAGFLDEFQQWSWNGPEDNQRILYDIVDALQNTPKANPKRPRRPSESPGGAVPLTSEFYIVRPGDLEFRDAIAHRDSIVRLEGARQMGKTSLLARGLQQAREEGAKVVMTDFQKLGNDDLESADKLYRALAEWIAVDLIQGEFPQKHWNTRRGPSINFDQFMQREVLGRFPEHVVWGLDEVDRLFSCPFYSEVFGLLRSWHNNRSLDPSGPWSRLTLAMAYATETHLFITDVNQSPFNVGTRITLEDFTFEQVSELNRRHGAPLRNDAELTQFFALVGGHPFLVRVGLHELVSRGLSVAELTAKADRDEGVFGDHLRRILIVLSRNAELLEIVRGILRGRPCPDWESFYRLRSAGIIAGESLEDAHLRCKVYESYLRRHLL